MPTLTPSPIQQNYEEYLAEPKDRGFTNGDCINEARSTTDADTPTVIGLMCDIANSQLSLEKNQLVNIYNVPLSSLNYPAAQAISDIKMYWNNKEEINLVAYKWYCLNQLPMPKMFTNLCTYGFTRSGIFCV